MTVPLASYIEELQSRVKAHLKACDASHDFSHIQRVVANAKRIIKTFKQFAKTEASVVIDEELVVLACVLHDVGDFKYSQR